jgi:ATP-dependent helicase IRC3
VKLRPYQREAIDVIKRKLWATVNNQVVKLPTGMGKTVLFAALPDELEFGNKRMMVLVHREELATQAADKLRKWNPSRTVGIEMAGSTASNAQLVVAGIQTVGRSGSNRLEQFDPSQFAALVCDESHHATAASYRRVFDHFDTKNRRDILNLGVTATVNRADGKGLGEVYQEIVYQMSILDAVRQGWLSHPRGRVVKTGVKLDGVHTRGGDFVEHELGNVVNTNERNETAVRAWLQYGEDRQTVAFAVDVAHAKALADTFKRYGVAAEAIWGDDPDRADKLKYHRAGSLKVLVNCQILTEGYDDWRIGCILLARPTQSEGLYTQIIGRGTRIPDDIDNLVEAKKRGIQPAKEDCIILDVVDTSSKHSLVTMPTLFGLNEKMDLKGKSIVQVMDEVEAIKQQKPYVDLSQVVDPDKLRVYAEEVDLFKVSFPPEIIQISEYQWRKTGNNAYVLLLQGKESVTVISDMLDKWHIVGTVGGVYLDKQLDSFDNAIREADFQVRLHGGRQLGTLIKRSAKWHKDPVQEGQLRLLRRFGVKIPTDAEGRPTITKGEAHVKLNELMGRNRIRRSA